MALTPTDPKEQDRTTENAIGQSLPTQAAENSPDHSVEENNDREKLSRRRILIGSERDPAAYRARRRRDWEPVVESESDKTAAQSADSDPTEDETEKEPPQSPGRETKDEPRVIPQSVLSEMLDEPAPLPTLPTDTMPASPGSFPPPNIHQRLAPDQEAEFETAMGGASLDQLLAAGDSAMIQEQLEVDSKHSARIVVVRKDDVFVELGSREQGVLSLQQFIDPPVIGGLVDVIVQRFNSEDGLYELMLPGTAVHVEDWSDLREGATVDVQVTGHNSGGLECEVNHIRGFIPISQVTMYRVEDLSEFVGQHFLCLVTEANPDRRNLVLSRRAILEREKAEAKQKLLESLKPGQIHDGVVRKLMPFGVFVDIGGVDGLLHVSQLAWGRVNHPSEVVAEGQQIRVRIEKIDPATGKISFAYRDLLENPWTQASQKYPPNSIVQGKVVKIMDFGAFVELEPGVEGLIHISQLSHKRVFRCTDVVKEGQQVEVMVLSVDQNAQRISLSIKALSQPEPTKKEKEKAEQEAAEAAAGPSKPKKPEKELPLTGGLGKSTGAKFGLKW
ncbi:MAG: S1 RNA-binding domain-containing protein [Thermoguttaceae bacterium]|jgi:small subunit ribosomal protein S1